MNSKKAIDVLYQALLNAGMKSDCEHFAHPVLCMKGDWERDTHGSLAPIILRFSHAL